MPILIPKEGVIGLKRIKAGFSLRGFASKAKIHYSTLSNVENAKGSVTPRTAKSICDVLEADFDELFEIVRKDGTRKGDANHASTT